MRKPSCDVLILQYFPSISEVEDLHSTYIANCVFNSFLCYTTIMLNIVTIHAIRKTSSLPNTLKTLLVSLAVSDVGVGLLVQPFYISLLVKWLQQNNSGCSAIMFWQIVSSLFGLVSFLGVVAISVDRFLAIHLHLRYQELVTHKRVVAVVISIWVFSVSFSLITAWVPSNIKYIIVCILGVVGLVLTTMVYIRIYLVVRRHKNHILSQNQNQDLQLQQVAQNSEMAANFASIIKSAAGIFYVYLLFWFCYLLFFISTAAIRINGPSIALKRSFLFSMTLLYLNSSLNPVIYCWKMKHIRHAIMNILRNRFSHQIRASH